MNVRDHSALAGLDLVHFDVEFDHARAVKSKAELESVRDSVRINQRGFEVFFDAYEPGRSAAEVMGAAEGYFVSEGCGRLTMNMVLTAPGRSGLATPEFKIARKEEILGDFLLPSLEVAGPGMHWVEVSRAVGTRMRRALRPHEAADGGLHGVLRGGQERPARGRDLPRRAPRRLRRLLVPRLPARATSRATRSA